MMTDQDVADIANALLAKRYYTRRSLSLAVGCSRDKLTRIAGLGLIPKYPKPLSKKQAATLGRKRRKLGYKFRLPNSPIF